MAGDDTTSTSTPQKPVTPIAQYQCPKLKNTNYTVWAIQIKVILEAHDLWEAIEPKEGTKVDNKKDKATTTFLYQALTEDVIVQVAGCETTKELWESLKTRHVGEEKVRQARLQSLMIEFNTLQMKEDDTVDAFTAKLNGYATKARELGKTLDESVLVQKLLDSTPDRFVLAGCLAGCDYPIRPVSQFTGSFRFIPQPVIHQPAQSGPMPAQFEHSVNPGYETPLPHAFSVGTLQDPATVGDDHTIPVTNTGHSILPTPHRSLHLNNVLITPHIVKNLIYVCQFVRDNSCTVEFDAFGFSVKDFMTRRVLLRCDSTGDLYPVTPPSPIHHAFLTSQHTWHQRLGHPRSKVLRRLVSRNPISCNKEKLFVLCHACQLGKHVRLLFVSFNTSVTSRFDIVHSHV
nr:zinc finger, CCHC-type [Tanacetum cinerariifolium]